MLIYKMFLRELIYEFKSIITYDCRDSYSVPSKTPHAKREVLKTKKMHMQLERLHLQQFLSHKSFAECFS